jgi:hypothetical protein
MYNNQTYLFTPAQKDANQLKAEFVIRKDVFEQIFSDIKEDKMEHPPQHFMILGQRGMGKTTLLLRLKYAIEDEEILNNWLLPVIFNEEQYAMSDLASFFEHIAELIGDKNPVYQSLLAQMRVHEFEDDYDQKSFDILAQSLKENNQKIAVFHDNFGDFLNKIGKNAIHRLRNILMNSPLIRLVGASATMLEHTYNYKEPFFDFFYQIRLNGLTTDETIILFEKLAEKECNYKEFQEKIKAGKSRIEVIRKLSGGVIRTMVMLFDVFMDNGQQDSFKDLEAILDIVTPLYKHRMDDLKPQQQIIVDAVARAWDAVTVSEISELCRAERKGLKTNQISAQLKQLVDNQIIEIETRTTGRTHLYRLQERFFNIWYLMRYSSRKDKQRVIWLVRFLESWCDSHDVVNIFNKFHQNLQSGVYSNKTVFERAYAYSLLNKEDIHIKKGEIISSAIEYLLANDPLNKDISVLSERFEELHHEVSFKYFNRLKGAISNYEEFFKLLNTGNELRFIEMQLEIIKNPILSIIIDNKKDYTENDIALLSISYNSLVLLDNNISNCRVFENKIPIFENSENNILIINFFLLLLARNGINSFFKIFNNSHPDNNLIDRFKPIYFFALELVDKPENNEVYRIGSELNETIIEIREKFEWLQKNVTSIRNTSSIK